MQVINEPKNEIKTPDWLDEQFKPKKRTKLKRGHLKEFQTLEGCLEFVLDLHRNPEIHPKDETFCIVLNPFGYNTFFVQHGTQIHPFEKILLQGTLKDIVSNFEKIDKSYF